MAPTATERTRGLSAPVWRARGRLGIGLLLAANEDISSHSHQSKQTGHAFSRDSSDLDLVLALHMPKTSNLRLMGVVAKKRS